VHQTLISVIVFYSGTLLKVHQTLISVIVFYSGDLLMVYQTRISVIVFYSSTTVEDNYRNTRLVHHE
jgi:hypothetical protein